MPSVSEKQYRFFLSELIKKQHNKKTKTGLSEKTIKEYLHKNKKRPNR